MATRAEVIEFANQSRRFGSVASDVVLASGGGGSWRNANSANYRFFQSAIGAFEKGMVFPHTYEYTEVSESNSEILYVSRDTSLSKKSIPQSSTCHDMAFFLQLPSLIRTDDSGLSGYFMRADPERHPQARSIGTGFDLSSMGNHLSQVTPFFQIIQQFSEISTDRMHVAIAGAMLGASVKLYPGNYGKAISVYRHSLLRNYPNVQIREWS